MEMACETTGWSRLSSLAQSAWFHMALSSNEQGEYYGGHVRLAKTLGKDLASVRKAIDVLLSAGYLKALRHDGGPMETLPRSISGGRRY